ncbi:hypothetical protein [Cupriavidus necator]
MTTIADGEAAVRMSNVEDCNKALTKSQVIENITSLVIFSPRVRSYSIAVNFVQKIAVEIKYADAFLICWARESVDNLIFGCPVNNLVTKRLTPFGASRIHSRCGIFFEVD